VESGSTGWQSLLAGYFLKFIAFAGDLKNVFDDFSKPKLMIHSKVNAKCSGQLSRGKMPHLLCF
jgi:hypothetical protein